MKSFITSGPGHIRNIEQLLCLPADICQVLSSHNTKNMLVFRNTKNTG